MRAARVSPCRARGYRGRVARASLVVVPWLLATALAAAQPGQGAGSDAGGESARADAGAQDDPGAALVAPCQTLQVDPIVGRFVDRQLRRTLADMGHRVLRRQRAEEVLSEVRAAAPPTMADLWRAAHRADASLAVFAVAWAERGRYVVQVRVASRDGSGPFYAEGDASAETLEPTVARLLREALSGPGSPATTGPAPGPDPESESESDGMTGPEPDSPPAARFFVEGRDAPPPLRRLRLSLINDYAFGLADDGFFNLLIGARAYYRVDRALSVGGSLAYVNLPTRDSRGGSLLPALSLQHSVAIPETASLGVLLGLQLGYLIDNGAVMQLSSGLDFAFDDRLRLALHLLAPTFWVTPERVLFSMNLGVELSLDF
jgi:hypothetical protein